MPPKKGKGKAPARHDPGVGSSSGSRGGPSSQSSNQTKITRVSFESPPERRGLDLFQKGSLKRLLKRKEDTAEQRRVKLSALKEFKLMRTNGAEDDDMDAEIGRLEEAVREDDSEALEAMREDMDDSGTISEDSSGLNGQFDQLTSRLQSFGNTSDTRSDANTTVSATHNDEGRADGPPAASSTHSNPRQTTRSANTGNASNDRLDSRPNAQIPPTNATISTGSTPVGAGSGAPTSQAHNQASRQTPSTTAEPARNPANLENPSQSSRTNDSSSVAAPAARPPNARNQVQAPIEIPTSHPNIPNIPAALTTLQPAGQNQVQAPTSRPHPESNAANRPNGSPAGTSTAHTSATPGATASPRDAGSRNQPFRENTVPSIVQGPGQSSGTGPSAQGTSEQHQSQFSAPLPEATDTAQNANRATPAAPSDLDIPDAPTDAPTQRPVRRPADAAAAETRDARNRRRSRSPGPSNVIRSDLRTRNSTSPRASPPRILPPPAPQQSGRTRNQNSAVDSIPENQSHNATGDRGEQLVLSGQEPMVLDDSDNVSGNAESEGQNAPLSHYQGAGSNYQGPPALDTGMDDLHNTDRNDEPNDHDHEWDQFRDEAEELPEQDAPAVTDSEMQVAQDNGPDEGDGQDDPRSPPPLTERDFQESRESELGITARGWRKRGYGNQVLVQLGPRDAATYRLEPGSETYASWNPASFPNISADRRGGLPDWPKTRLKAMMVGIKGVAWKVFDGNRPLVGMDPNLKRRYSRSERFTDCVVDIEWRDQVRTWETRAHVRSFFLNGRIHADEAIFKRAVEQEDMYNRWLVRQRQRASVPPAPAPQNVAYADYSAERPAARGSRNAPIPRRRGGRRTNDRRTISDAPPPEHDYEQPESDGERDVAPRQSASRSSRGAAARSSSRRRQEQDSEDEPEPEPGSDPEPEPESEQESEPEENANPVARQSQARSSRAISIAPQPTNRHRQRLRESEPRDNRSSASRHQQPGPGTRNEPNRRERQPEARRSEPTSSRRRRDRVGRRGLPTPSPTPEYREQDDRSRPRRERAETFATGERSMPRLSQREHRRRNENIEERVASFRSWHDDWLRTKGFDLAQSLPPQQSDAMMADWNAYLLTPVSV